ncbi:hypothetical protein [Streptococcus pyogenes]
MKDIERNAFGFRNFDNFKTRIFIALNMQKEKTISPPLGLSHKSPTTVDSEHFSLLLNCFKIPYNLKSFL